MGGIPRGAAVMEFTVFKGIEEDKGFIQIETSAPIRAKHPVMSSDGRALWNGSEAWFWVMPEIDGETFYFYLDAVGPVSPWMQYIEDTEGLSFALFPDSHDGAELAKELMALGVAPEQPFFVHMTFSAGRDYWGEYWDEIDWELRDVEKLPPNEVAQRWADWLTEWRSEPEETP
ncbi:hypothetical protein N9917_00180 [Deltaproteobacteria bacterium]|nr:hypothetical protein [Deltaproteobacteria bacterium]